MSSKRETTIKKHRKIEQFFDSLYNVKEEVGGKLVRRNHYDWCLAKTAEEFYCSMSTVQKVINHWV
jgi:hypothetical protein